MKRVPKSLRENSKWSSAGFNRKPGVRRRSRSSPHLWRFSSRRPRTFISYWLKAGGYSTVGFATRVYPFEPALFDWHTYPDQSPEAPDLEALNRLTFERLGLYAVAPRWLTRKLAGTHWFPGGKEDHHFIVVHGDHGSYFRIEGSRFIPTENASKRALLLVKPVRRHDPFTVKKEKATLLDVAPTILDAAGVKTRVLWSGRALGDAKR